MHYNFALYKTYCKGTSITELDRFVAFAGI